MKNDMYTKTVLTIIAGCLVVLIFKNLDLMPKAYAMDTSINTAPINTNYRLIPTNSDGSINVTLVNSNELDVNIVGIDTRDELDINIDEVGGGYISYGGSIPVEIED